MTENLFPENVTQINQDRIKDLACNVYNTEPELLTKEQLMHLVMMDMATFPTKLTVSAAGTRPTEVKYSTNNYHASMDIDLKGVNDVITSTIQEIEDKGESINTYLAMKSTFFSLIRAKYEGTENYIRELLAVAMDKDGCPKVGRNSK